MYGGRSRSRLTEHDRVHGRNRNDFCCWKEESEDDQKCERFTKHVAEEQCWDIAGPTKAESAGPRLFNVLNSIQLFVSRSGFIERSFILYVQDYVKDGRFISDRLNLRKKNHPLFVSEKYVLIITNRNRYVLNPGDGVDRYVLWVPELLLKLHLITQSSSGCTKRYSLLRI